MELKNFFMAMTMAEREAFARRCGTSRAHVTNVAYKTKPCSPKLAVEIDRESGGVVSCDTLSSDVDWDWVRRSSDRKNEA